MGLVSNIVILILTSWGIYVCYTRIKNDIIYRYGIWFFMLVTVSYIIKLIIYFSIPKLGLFLRGINVSYSNIAMIIFLIKLPSILFLLVAFIVLIVGFYRYMKA
ncbi:hypothetical protein MOOR_20050 [Moorella thermoacetica]|uniref:Uncharacterized protein n=1 Tax=Neomoorella thermoacetica TaxID=1525 RepID=A0A1J5NLW1_NEOTH|nr:hypothetical protein MOOR_20050 [Moorella thermoacetica]OIQ59606.1 hypothetical protein MTIN_21800 [Moorella thermoacetica]